MQWFIDCDVDDNGTAMLSGAARCRVRRHSVHHWRFQRQVNTVAARPRVHDVLALCCNYWPVRERRLSDWRDCRFNSESALNSPPPRLLRCAAKNLLFYSLPAFLSLTAVESHSHISAYHFSDNWLLLVFYVEAAHKTYTIIQLK